MDDLTEADMIWNRACGEDRLRSLAGDRALVDLLRVHALVMNGGVLNAVECLNDDELSYAESGFRFYGIEGIGPLLSRARRILDEDDDLENHEGILDAEYAHIIPSDSSLLERFKMRLKSSPMEFAPVRPRDMGRGETRHDVSDLSSNTASGPSAVD